MKKTNVFYFSLVMVMLASTIFSFVLFLLPRKTNKVNLIEKTSLSVVEIKAVSENVGESFGTAVFVCDDGTLVTNAHVVTFKRLGEVHTFDEISIRFSFESEYRLVTLEKFDNDKDLAILKLNDTNCNFKAIDIGDSSKVSAGDEVFAVGNLNNVGISLTKGIVSNSKINVEYNNIIREVIQCDLTIADGNSGGALVDSNGKLLGITTFRLKDNSGNVIYGIAYCIPSSVVLEYIKN